MKEENNEKKTRQRYRLLFMNEREQKVVFSVRLYTWVAALLLTLLITLTAVLVVLIMTRTPLRSFLPGYLDVSKRSELAEATLRLDSLERESTLRSAYLANLTAILSGRIEVDSIVPFGTEESVRFNDSLREAGEREQEFTAAFEEQERFSLNALTAQPAPTGLSFIAPVKGAVISAEAQTSVQSASGVRRVNELRIEPVRPYTVLAPADGVVVAVNRDAEGLYSLLIQHTGDCLTELSHLTKVWVEAGQGVRAGGVVAEAEADGKEPTWVGIRIWQRGASVDPRLVLSY
jgi:murein DD-endopeptidase MepM/ murein hydrolase activator NlpD